MGINGLFARCEPGKARDASCALAERHFGIETGLDKFVDQQVEIAQSVAGRGWVQVDTSPQLFGVFNLQCPPKSPKTGLPRRNLIVGCNRLSAFGHKPMFATDTCPYERLHDVQTCK